jgi:hypothetical protein
LPGDSGTCFVPGIARPNQRGGVAMVWLGSSSRFILRFSLIVPVITFFILIGSIRNAYCGPLPLEIERHLSEAGLGSADFTEMSQYENQNCTVLLSDSEMHIGASGGATAIRVHTTGVCVFDGEVGTIPWVKVDTGKVRAPENIITYTVSPNNAPAERTAAMSVANKIVTITQAGISQVYAGRAPR